MLSRIAAAALAAGALACHVPAAHAAPPARVGCDTERVTRETTTSGQDLREGVYGYVVGDAAETSVSVYCEIRVNGAGAGSTPVGTGSVAAVTRGLISYNAADADVVDLCAVWTTSTDAGEVCGDITTTQIPPQVVIDLIMLITPIPDSLVCPVLASLPPVTGLVDVNAEGDVTMPEPIGKVWDCPPYDWEQRQVDST